MERPKKKHRVFPRTDAGNAELLAYYHGDELRFDHQRNRWMIWNGNSWEVDKKARVYQFAKVAARTRANLREELFLQEEDQNLEFSWAKRQELALLVRV